MPLIIKIKKEKKKCLDLKKRNERLEIDLLKSKEKNLSYHESQDDGNILEIQHLFENAPFGESNFVKELTEENRRLQEELNMLKLKYKGKEEQTRYLSVENENLNLKATQNRILFDTCNKELKKIKGLYLESTTQLKLSRLGNNSTPCIPNFKHQQVQTDFGIHSELQHQFKFTGKTQDDIIHEMVEKTRKIQELQFQNNAKETEINSMNNKLNDFKLENQSLREELADTLVLIKKLEAL